MTIPILIGGLRRGALEIRADGAYTRFEARCDPLPGLRRLWVFGGGARACLGVLAPEGGALTLRRRLSRAALRSFPEPIEYAALSADAGQEQAQKEEKHDSAPHEKAAPHEKGAPHEETAPHEKAAPYEKGAPRGAWSEQPDGSLVCTENGVRLLALPCALRRVPPGVDLREIAGKRCLVFRY